MGSSRARNNRTLTLTDDERVSLGRQLLTPTMLDADSAPLDALVHADLMDVLDLLPDAMADLVIVDPPYNLRKTFGQTAFAARSDDAYEAYLRTWFGRVCRKLKPHGSLYMCGDWRSTAAMQRVMATELTIMNRITWQREKGRGATRNWKNAMEDVWFGVKSAADYTFDVDAVRMRRRVVAPYRQDGQPKDWSETTEGRFRDTCPSNFWDDISVPFWSMPENTEHPTQKPEKLYAKMILASSREGDVVLDPFMGSGTACVVAKKLRRHYVGIEMNEEYCLWAAKRIALADADSSIQGYADGVFWERNTLAARQTSKPRP